MGLEVERARSLVELDSVIESRYYRGDTYLTQLQANPFSLEFFNSTVTSVARFTGSGLGMRRLWKHIRDKSCDMYVIWLVISGQSTITQDSNQSVVCEPGKFYITYGDRPFHVKAEPASDKNCTQLHILVPSHLLRSRIPNIDRFCGRIFDGTDASAAMGLRVYASLLEERADIRAEISNAFALAALDAICATIRDQTHDALLLVDSKRTNLERVLRFIDQHIATQGLTAGRVAEACNMSRRYLHYLLKHANMSFGGYIWEARLQQAKQWLHDPEFMHFNIVDIAYMTGFKSSSHFSSAFRSRFGYTPRDERINPRPASDENLVDVVSNPG